VALPNGQVIQAGSIVTRSGDAIRVVTPDGTVVTGPYSSVTGQPGAAAGGNGVWLVINESMSDSAAAYQAQVTGQTGYSYVVNGVKFNGYQNDALIDAKGPGYANFADSSAGGFKPFLLAAKL
jgi:hypothetical protein